MIADRLIPPLLAAQTGHAVSSKRETIDLEVVVIGGGQSGLAMGYHLKRAGKTFVILDAGPEVGHSWRSRWDSLKLFTSARFSALPDLRFPGNPDRYPAKDEVADYLAGYAREFALPVILNEEVSRLTRAARGYVVETARTSYRAQTVVIAVGGRHSHQTPELAHKLSGDIQQLHTGEYRNPEQLTKPPILVVGSGDSGRQIAHELVLADRHVTLAHGSWRLRFPQRFLGRDIFSWLDKINALAAPANARRSRWIRQRDPVVGPALSGLRKLGVRVVPRLMDADEDRVMFSDGTSTAPRTVVWATGFRSDFSWIDVPVVDRAGAALHHEGITAVPGLYFLGLPWQRLSGSALLGWVGEDARFLLDHMAAGVRSR